MNAVLFIVLLDNAEPIQAAAAVGITMGRVQRARHQFVIAVEVAAEHGLVEQPGALFEGCLGTVEAGGRAGVVIKNTPYEGILRGSQNGKQLILSDISLERSGDETRKPAPGDIVFTSGRAGIFPESLHAGIIQEETGQDEYRVKPLFEFEKVKAVQVLTSSILDKEFLSILPSQ